MTCIDGVVFAGATPDEVMSAAAERARAITGADIGLVVADGDPDQLPAGCVHAGTLQVATPERNHGSLVLGWIDPLRLMSPENMELARGLAAQVAVTVSLAQSRIE